MSGLRERRQKLGLSLRDVEEITAGAVSNAYLSQIETGKIKNPSILIARHLSAAYAVPLDTVAEWLGQEVSTPITCICPTCGQALSPSNVGASGNE